MLNDPLRRECGVAGQMHFAVLQKDVAVGTDQHRSVEAPFTDRTVFVGFVRDFGIPQMEANPVFARGGEQRRCLVGRHGGLEPMVRLRDVLVIVAGKERGQRQFREYDQFHAALVRPFHQPNHTFYRHRARFSFLDRAQLRGGDGDGAGHAGQHGMRRTNRPSPGCARTVAPSQIFRPRK